VVGNPVEQDTQPALVGGGEERIECAEVSEQRVDVPVVADVVAVVAHR
jgi:hypothetical protein